MPPSQQASFQVTDLYCAASSAKAGAAASFGSSSSLSCTTGGAAPRCCLASFPPKSCFAGAPVFFHRFFPEQAAEPKLQRFFPPAFFPEEAGEATPRQAPPTSAEEAGR